MTLTDWVLGEVRKHLPNEAILRGPRSDRTFDGRPVAADVRRCIVVHTIGPTHAGVSLNPGTDVATIRLIAHTFALTAREVEERRAAFWRSIRHRAPDVDGWSWGFPDHPTAIEDDPDTSLGVPLLHVIDEYTYSGLEA